MEVPALADIVPEDRLEVVVIERVNEIDQVYDVKDLLGPQVIGAKIDGPMVVMRRVFVVAPDGSDGRLGVVERPAEGLDDGDDADYARIEGLVFLFESGFEKIHDRVSFCGGSTARALNF